jgi:Universal stress protein family
VAELTKAGAQIGLGNHDAAVACAPVLFDRAGWASIVGFEIEMILARLKGPHVPACSRPLTFGANPIWPSTKFRGRRSPIAATRCCLEMRKRRRSAPAARQRRSRALIEFARANGIDQIVMGACGSSTLRRYLGSVSGRVVAEAACTVTVVRVA